MCMWSCDHEVLTAGTEEVAQPLLPLHLILCRLDGATGLVSIRGNKHSYKHMYTCVMSEYTYTLEGRTGGRGRVEQGGRRGRGEGGAQTWRQGHTREYETSYKNKKQLTLHYGCCVFVRVSEWPFLQVGTAMKSNIHFKPPGNSECNFIVFKWRWPLYKGGHFRQVMCPW